MTSSHRATLRGQGLIANDIGAIARRWLNYMRVILVTVIVGGLIGGHVMGKSSPAHLRAALMYVEATIKQQASPASMRPQRFLSAPPGWPGISPVAVLRAPAYVAAADRLKVHLQLGGSVGLAMGLILCAAWSRWMAWRGARASNDGFRRGARLASEAELRALVAPRSGRHALSIGSVPLPEDLETRHLALIGTTGSGKTTVLRQMLDDIERRGHAAIVYDTSGEFVAHYYRPDRGDIILNPFDSRAAYWSPFDELSHPADAERIAHQLVPSPARAEDDVWISAARALVANVLRELWRDGRADLPTLFDTLQHATKEELKARLQGTSSARTFEADAEKATASVLFMLAKAASALQFLQASPGKAGRFSFKRFFEELDATEGPKPWVFVARKEEYFDATKPLLACFLECAATALMATPPSRSRRVWFILDELADLPKVDNLARLLPQGRKFGAAAVLAFQAIGQMRDRYGKDGAEALLACANTKLFLQVLDPDTRRWASQCIGDAEVETTGGSDALDFEIGKGRTSLSTSRHIRPRLLESEFLLERHRGFLQLPDGYPVARVELSDRHIRDRGRPKAVGFIPGDVNRTLAARSTIRNTGASHPVPDGGPV